MRLLPCPLALILAFFQREKEPDVEDRSVRENRAAALSCFFHRRKQDGEHRLVHEDCAAALSYSLSLWERVGVRASGRQSNHNVQTASAASTLI